MIQQQDIEAAEKLNVASTEKDDERIAQAIATARQQGADAMQEAIAAKFDQEASDALKQVRICRVNDRESRRDAARKLSEAERAAKMVRGVGAS